MAKKLATRNAPVDVDLVAGFAAALSAVMDAANAEGKARNNAARARGERVLLGSDAPGHPFHYLADKLVPLIHYAEKRGI